MSRRSEATRRRGLDLDAFEEPVKREIEIEPRLFAIGDDVESGLQLVVYRGNNCVVDQFFAVRFVTTRVVSDWTNALS